MLHTTCAEKPVLWQTKHTGAVDCQHDILEGIQNLKKNSNPRIFLFFFFFLGWEAAVVIWETHTVVPRGAAGVDESTCIILHRDRWMRVWQSLAGDKKWNWPVCDLMYFLLKMLFSFCRRNIMMLFCQEFCPGRCVWICIYILRQDLS